MKFVFASNHLQRCFENSDEAVRTWGQDVGRKYIQRIQVLQGAATLAHLREFQALRLHALKGPGPDSMRSPSKAGGD